jgi:hypothetical protein
LGFGVDAQTITPFEASTEVNLSWQGSSSPIHCCTPPDFDCEEWLGKNELCNGGYDGGWEVETTDPVDLIKIRNRCTGKPSGNWGSRPYC